MGPDIKRTEAVYGRHLGDTVLISTHSGNHAQSPGADLLTSIADDTNDNLLPTFLAPGLAPIAFAEVRDVLDYTMHRAAEKLIVFVVHRHDNEQLGSTRRVVVYLSQSEARVLEVVRVASSCGVAHMSEFTLISQGTHVQQLCWDRRIQDKVPVEQSAGIISVTLGPRGEVRTPLS